MDLNQIIQIIIFVLSGGLLTLSIIPFFGLAKITSYTDPASRKKALQLSDTELKINGGELEPIFWGQFINELKSSSVQKVELIFGPRLILEKKKYDDFVRPFKEDPLRLQEDNLSWLDCHPVLSYFRANYESNPEGMSLYLKIASNDAERHFSVGNAGNVIIENAHGRNLPKGGIISAGDSYLYKKHCAEFERIRESRDYCLPFKLENACQLFNHIRFEYPGMEIKHAN